MLTAAQLGLTGPIGARPVTAMDLSAWRRRIVCRGQRCRREILETLGVTLLIDGAVIGGCIAAGAVLRRPLHEAYITGALAVGGAVCLFTLWIAVLTKPDGRAEVASQLAEHGFRQACRSSNPVAGTAGIVILIVALYGSFTLVEAARRTFARWRFASVDRDEMARILGLVCATPMGVSTSMLLKHGQTMDDLRRPVAALLLDGWVVLRDGGRVVQQRPQGDRSLRSTHPLVEVFASGGFDAPV